MKIINLPIEPLAERYSSQWDRWFKRAFRGAGIPHVSLQGTGGTGIIRDGAFLDVIDTNVYKLTQTRALLNYVQANREHMKGSVVFFHDLWHPGLVPLAYVRDGLGLPFKICGCLHAGSYDPWDFLARRGMDVWAREFEQSVFKIVDGVFLATKFHRRLLLSKRKVDPKKLHVTGFPIYADEVAIPTVKKDPLVVFPHRLDPEKRPELFDELRERVSLGGIRFVRTRDVCGTKGEYYQLLRHASVAVSFAAQETWGIAMQEALFNGCVPFVPPRLSYSEMYPPTLWFRGVADLARKISSFFQDPSFQERATLAAEQARGLLAGRGRGAIDNILLRMRKETEDA